MLISDFDYILPAELIAQQPLPERDQSRMMVVNRRTGAIIHSSFRNFPGYLNPGEVLALNTSKVIPARAWGKKGGKEIKFLFLKELKKGKWEVLCRPARKVQRGDLIIFSPGLKGQVVETGPEGKRVMEFLSVDVFAELRKIGYAPLPPYIKRRKDLTHRRLDLERYQTVYAQREGSIAAPTAGLHLTPGLLEQIKRKGVRIARISLDVGQATFQPVRTRDVEEHRMLEETYTISREAAQVLNQAKKSSKPVIAVGTTSVRTLESSFQGEAVHSGTRSTDLFIYPGFPFRVVDRLLTNFHLPRSTLLMLVCAFAGLDLIRKAYQEAIAQRYRFFSYGDCMLIL